MPRVACLIAPKVTQRNEIVSRWYARKFAAENQPDVARFLLLGNAALRSWVDGLNITYIVRTITADKTVNNLSLKVNL